jgi:hypothetical protein
MLFFMWLDRKKDSEKSRREGFAMGLFAGLLTLTRGVFALYAPFLIGAFLLRRRFHVSVWFIVFLMVGWMIPIGSWTIYNWTRYRLFIPITVQTGNMLYDGLSFDNQDRVARITAKPIEIKKTRPQELLRSRPLLRKESGRFYCRPSLQVRENRRDQSF